MPDHDTPRPRVLLVSAQGNWAGLLRLPYMLKRTGATVAMFGPANSRLRRSRFVSEIYAAPTNTPAFIDALREHLSRHTYAWVVIGDDPTLVAIAQSAGKDGGDWIDGWFPVDRQQCLEMIFSKSLFAEACPKFDVPIPHSRICHSFEEVDRAAREIGFPIMLKTAIGSAGNGVQRIDKPEDLPEAYDTFKHRTPLVIQEFVVGQIGSTQMMFDRGRPICWVPAYKAVCFPEPFGPSCVRELLDQQGVDAMKPIVANVGRMTNFHGMCGIDWIRRADGSFAILEFNPRPTSTIHLGRLMGADCAVALKAMFAGQYNPQVPAECKPSHRRVYMFPQHPQRCLRYAEYRQLIHWLPGAGVRDIPWQEPILLMADLWSLTQIAFKKLKKAIFRIGGKPKQPAVTPVRAAMATDEKMVAKA
jgi:predicted ATP-grasp superfamily ATP-dependent carboligase